MKVKRRLKCCVGFVKQKLVKCAAIRTLHIDQMHRLNIPLHHRLVVQLHRLKYSIRQDENPVVCGGRDSCPCGACLSFLFVANQRSQSYFAHVVFVLHYSDRDEEARICHLFSSPSTSLPLSSLLFSFTLHTYLFLLPSLLPSFSSPSSSSSRSLFPSSISSITPTPHSHTHTAPFSPSPSTHFSKIPWTRQNQPHLSRPSSSPSALPRVQPSPPPSLLIAPFSSSRRNSPPLTCLLPRFVSSTLEESSRMTTNSLSTVSALYIPTKYFLCVRVYSVLCVMMALVQKGCPLRKCEQGMTMQLDKSYFLLSPFIAVSECHAQLFEHYHFKSPEAALACITSTTTTTPFLGFVLPFISSSLF